MRKYLLNILSVSLAITLTAFQASKIESSKSASLKYLYAKYHREINLTNWAVYKYIGGPHCEPSSYLRILPQLFNIEEYCPEDEVLCAIIAEQDAFNPEHPTQQSIDYLIMYFGFYSYFPNEEPGVIEFREAQ